MSATNAQNLLRAYVEQGSETAFQELVTRYLDLVYATAFRRVNGDTLLAQDVAQTVFIDLARKASSLPREVQLGGWLHHHTCWVASTAMRGEQRRRLRERTAAEMITQNATPESSWQDLAPVLDETLDELEGADRDALILRFFEQADLRAVGMALGVGADAAQKRVARALDKLRGLLEKRGVRVASVVLGTMLASRAVTAAPVGLAQTIGAAALAGKGAGVGWGAALAGGLSLLKSKLVLAVAAAAALVLLVGFPVGLWNRGGPPVGKSEDVATRPDVRTGVSLSVQESETNDPAGTLALVEQDQDLAVTNSLRLSLVAADTGLPVPNVPLDCRVWMVGKVKDSKLQADRLGVCRVPLLEVEVRPGGEVTTLTFDAEKLPSRQSKP